MTDHCRFDTRTQALVCTHCGQTYQPTLPAPIDMFVAMSEAFVKQHRRCRPSTPSSATRSAGSAESFGNQGGDRDW